MKTWAFAQISRDQFLLLEGPLSFHDRPRDGDAMIYAPDFFLRERLPWIRGVRSALLGLEEWRARFPLELHVRPVGIDWAIPDRKFFEDSFRDLFKLFGDGCLHKGVPATICEGRFQFDSEAALHWLARAGHLRDNLFAYGVFDGEEGMIGATPEVLFDYQGSEIHTMALAGTRAASDPNLDNLAEHPKDAQEHRLVVDSIRGTLSAFGAVEVGSTRVENFGFLHHLLTPLSVYVQVEPRFEDLVAALHPTPALGVFPRNDTGLEWLRSMESRKPRRRFGAPFGVHLPSGLGKCWVAIRNIQFQKDSLQIWAGCGVVADSELESEWKEICSKIDAVRSTWA